MKITTTLFILFSTIASAQINLNLGIIAYYPMNNSGVDTTSNNLDLTATGSPAGTTDRYGAANGAYLLSSINPDYFTAPMDPLLAPAELTVSAWVNLPNTFNDQKIAGRAEVGAGGYLMGVDSNKLDAEIWDLTGFHFRLKTDQVPPNVWTHLAISYKASDYLKVYINGVARDSTPASVYGAGTSNIWPLTIGGAPWQPFALNASGSLDDIYIYNRALNNDEVFVLFNDPTGISEPSQIGTAVVYPVPSHNGKVNIAFRSPVSEMTTISVTDMLGKEVIRTEQYTNQNLTLDLSRFAKGLYSVTLNANDRSELHRIVID